MGLLSAQPPRPNCVCHMSLGRHSRLAVVDTTLLRTSATQTGEFCSLPVTRDFLCIGCSNSSTKLLSLGRATSMRSTGRLSSPGCRDISLAVQTPTGTAEVCCYGARRSPQDAVEGHAAVDSPASTCG